jgi:hypothetical protein
MQFAGARREMILRALKQGWTVTEVLDALQEAKGSRVMPSTNAKRAIAEVLRRHARRASRSPMFCNRTASFMSSTRF